MLKAKGKAKVKVREEIPVTISVKEKVSKLKRRNWIWVEPESGKTLYKIENCNRPIIPKQVTTLVKSIQRIGIVRPVIVCRVNFIHGVMRTYILDGQHLQTGAERLGIEFPYVEIEVKDKAEMVEIIALLNSSSKSWTFNDYITAWSSLDNREDYRKLLKYKQVYDMTFETLAVIFTNSERWTAARKIKDGSFVITNEAAGVEILNDLNEIFENMNRGNRLDIREFVIKYARWRYLTGKNYDHKKFVEYVRKNKDFINNLIGGEDEIYSFLERFKFSKS